MYSIGEISKLTGITAFTLRFYEKAGVLPGARREGGVRRYDDQDLRYHIENLDRQIKQLEAIKAIAMYSAMLDSETTNLQK